MPAAACRGVVANSPAPAQSLLFQLEVIPPASTLSFVFLSKRHILEHIQNPNELQLQAFETAILTNRDQPQ